MFQIRFGRLLLEGIVKFPWLRKTPVIGDVAIRSVPVFRGEIEARIFSPVGAGPFPVVLYFHGGGFVVGSTAVYDPICRDFCSRTQHMVVSIDYRLAPEYPFPCAANDCGAAARWLANNCETINGDPDRVFIYGDSAGGNLAAVTVSEVRKDLPGFFKGQILVYPVLDDFKVGTESYAEFERCRGLSSGMMRWFWKKYLLNSVLDSSSRFQHDLATPATVSDLSGLPPTLLVAAGIDPLRDEGLSYSERLKEQGTEVEYVAFETSRHGFVGTSGPKDDHVRAMQLISQWLKER